MQFASTIVLGFIAIVAAVPLPLPGVTDGISQDLLDRFQLFRQYSTASGCPNNTVWGTPNTKVKCTSGCPLVEAAGATVIRGGHTPIGDIAAYLAVDPTNSLLVLAVRGTASPQNDLVDALIALVPWNFCAGCLIHEGFYSAWRELRAYLLPALTAAVATYPGYQIVTTGHSLGGAIAIIAAAELRNKGMKVEMVPQAKQFDGEWEQYNYGQPRVGNAALAAYVTAQAPALGNNYRATHTDDPVPRLPDTVMGYKHTKPEYWIFRGDDDIQTGDVRVFEAADDRRGNAGTGGFDVEAHMHYFGPISRC